MKKITFKKDEVYHAKTQKEANFILDEAHAQGLQWIDGCSCDTSKNWSYKEDTTYNIYKNVSFQSINGVFDKKIIEIEDLMNSNGEEYNSLPKEWCILTDNSQYFKETVLEYLNKHTPQKWTGVNDKNCYYGIIGNNSFCSIEPKSTLKKITIEEFIEYTQGNNSLVDNLPKYWAIKGPIKDTVIQDYLNDELEYNLTGTNKELYYSNQWGAATRLEKLDPSTILFHSIGEWEQAKKGKQITKTINKKQKQENYENTNEAIEVCRVTPTVTRGQEIRGNSISSRTSRTTIERGYISYQEISC